MGLELLMDISQKIPCFLTKSTTLGWIKLNSLLCSQFKQKE
jgi:hypothetical protein